MDNRGSRFLETYSSSLTGLTHDLTKENIRTSHIRALATRKDCTVDNNFHFGTRTSFIVFFFCSLRDVVGDDDAVRVIRNRISQLPVLVLLVKLSTAPGSII